MSELTYPLLCQLPCALVLAVPQQFDDSSLIGCEAGDFLDDLTDEGGALGEVALCAGDAWFRGEGGDFLFSKSVQLAIEDSIAVEAQADVEAGSERTVCRLFLLCKLRILFLPFFDVDFL